MRLATLKNGNEEFAGLVLKEGIAPIGAVNKVFSMNFSTDIYSLLKTGEFDTLREWYDIAKEGLSKELAGSLVKYDEAAFGPLYREPRKIFGIGLNYADHAADLAEVAPTTEPASFFKPATTIIGPEDTIKIPLQSEKTTGEAELGLIFKKRCKDAERKDWKDYIAGYTTIIDMTAEDILRRNPRYLTRAKSFDTFFSFGPQLVSTDEVGDVLALHVATIINGKVHAENVVANMTFPPDYLVSFHSKVMPMLPGDIISTGTPRAVHIQHGDVIGCRIDGFATLQNPVIDLKVTKKQDK